MATQRERIHEEFVGTADEAKADFCRRLFIMHLQATIDEPTRNQRMEHFLEALEEAIVEDAARPDLWQKFRAWLYAELKPLQEEQDRKNQEMMRKRREGGR